MSTAFDILSGALIEAIKDTKTKTLPRKHRYLKIEPIKEYSSKEIKDIRNKTGLTQSLFAKYFGVSLKTVEAWESGRNKPSGPSSRLLWLLDAHKITI